MKRKKNVFLIFTWILLTIKQLLEQANLILPVQLNLLFFILIYLLTTLVLVKVFHGREPWRIKVQLLIYLSAKEFAIKPKKFSSSVTV